MERQPVGVGDRIPEAEAMTTPQFLYLLLLVLLAYGAAAKYVKD